ncbi:TatD family deoxyribonuclease [Labilibaculum sp. A4]|uniref:TatD family deoxyribonuclease n=1 Tax=Labilibaculum euxinus TaxID=2686357 RepID=A0A425YAU3_9BACT|nr:TatD family hydrolase [Labilibaculum euxinus]MDQ1771175.1 TatD family hydrolase [Labilibaculum euxinus]MUP39964.1 TatD family deoxyribonuclease [Labilibaculum euxinus]MVB09169.1 TatD family deoxyribonuclease [Labilibaculum euxinus]MWN76818.1 TatD family deoxyribonuclease [Labilibaculum euxinus]
MTLSVAPYINIHTHNFSSQSNVRSIRSIQPEEQLLDSQTMYYSVGIHPWTIKSVNIPSALNKMRNRASYKSVLAIGEIGLDRIIETPLSIQKEIFLKQLQIADQFNKPVIIHCVKCYSEIISIRKKTNTKLPWIIHGFVKNLQIAEDLIELGCYISFGKALLINKNLQHIFKTLPVKKIFLETDDSDTDIEEIYKKAATIKDLKIEDLQKELLSNFTTCFNK